MSSSASAELSDGTAYGSPRPQAAGSTAAVSILVGALIALSYVVVSLWINGGNLFKPSFVDYYTRVMASIAHGHLWIPSDARFFDLVEFQGRAYLYWGLSPLLLIAPFYFLGHGLQFDIAYTLVLGLANVAALSWMIREAAKALSPSGLPYSNGWSSSSRSPHLISTCRCRAVSGTRTR
jgi:hypothetical protein